MSLTHVCVWDGKAGYRRVSIEEACSMYPYTVSANSEIFVCSLCAQPVCLTTPGKQRRNFRHNSATQNKECEDRAQAYVRASTGYNCHPMPLRIKVVAPKILCKGKTARRLQFNLRGKVSPCPVSIPYHGEAGAVKGKSAAYLYGSGSPW